MTRKYFAYRTLIRGIGSSNGDKPLGWRGRRERHLHRSGFGVLFVALIALASLSACTSNQAAVTLPPASIAATAGNAQSTLVNTAFKTNLQATVKDKNGVPLPGTTLTFTVVAAGNGASGVFAGGTSSPSVTTDSNGVATAPTISANATSGSFAVNASAGGVGPAVFNLTNTAAGSPANITATGGTPQGATVNTIFTTSLQATVTDAAGNPVANASVTFTAVAAANGASGTFNNGTASLTVTTSASGVATASTFTANAVAGAHVVNATVPGVAAPAVFNLTNTAQPLLTIAATSGTPQSAPINQQFPNKLQATVTDSTGKPVANAQVTFTAPSSGASGTFANGTATDVETTNANGAATSTTFTANATSGSYVVNATVSNGRSPAPFNLANNAPSSINAQAGTPQSTAINSVFMIALQARVADQNLVGVPNVSVTFTAVAAANGASGTFTNGTGTVTVTTGANGIAIATTFTANAMPGSYIVNATTAGIASPAVFSLTNNDAPAAITAIAGTPQNAAINATFAVSLQAKVTDGLGAALANVQVTFTAPSNGASGSFGNGLAKLSVTTNANGIATATSFTANGTAGAYAVNATVTGVNNPAVFNLTNATAGPAANIAAAAGNPESATINSAYPINLQALVTDANGLAVANVQVTFTAVPGATGSSGTFANGTATGTTTTNNNVLANATTLKANAIAGSFVVNATVNGVAAPAVFNLTNIQSLVCPQPILGNENEIHDVFAFLFDGWDDVNGPFQAAGAFATDGTGNVVHQDINRTNINGLAGELDLGALFSSVAQGRGPQFHTIETAGSCYNLGPDGRGTLVFTLHDKSTITFDFSILPLQRGSATASTGRLLRFDDANAAGIRGTGFFTRQGSTTVPPPPNPNPVGINGQLGYSVTSYTANNANSAYLRNGMIGICCDTTSNGGPQGLAEVALTSTDANGNSTGAQSNFDLVPMTITVGAGSPDGWGRGTLQLSFSSYPKGDQAENFNYAYYGSQSVYAIQSTDFPGPIVPLSNGQLKSSNGFGCCLAGVYFATGADLSSNQAFTISTVAKENDQKFGTSFTDEISGQVPNNLAVYTNNQMVGTFSCWGTVIPQGGCLTNPMGVLTLTPSPTSPNPNGPTLTFTMLTTNLGAFLLEGTGGANGLLNPAPGKNAMIGEVLLGTSSSQPPFGGTDQTFSTLYPASTGSSMTVGTATATGAVAAPPPPPPPAAFSGTHVVCVNSATCVAGATQSVAANYSIDSNGRITFDFGAGGFPSGIAPGWVIPNSPDGVLLEPSVNGTVIFVGQTLIP